MKQALNNNFTSDLDLNSLQSSLMINSKVSQPNLAGQEDIMDKIWSAFGLYILRQMSMGRGIAVPKFGIFTFSAPDVILEGVTNPQIRDKQYRIPVFLVSKDFTKGKLLKTGIYCDNHVRPYLVQTSGIIQCTKLNIIEISQYADLEKENIKYGLQRMIRSIEDKCRQNQNLDLTIPGVGVFKVRNSVVAVAFSQEFVKATKGIMNQPISSRKKNGDTALFNQTQSILHYRKSMDQGDRYQVDQSAQEFLQTKYVQRPQTAQLFNESQKQIPNNLQQSNQQFKLDQKRISLPIGLEVSGKSFSQEQLALRKLKFWVRDKAFKSQDAYLELCNQAIGRNRDQNIQLNLQQFTNGINKIGLNLTNDQCESLFQLLDQNKDSKLTYLDWSQLISDENSHLDYIRDVIYKKQLHTDDIFKSMQLHREHAPIDIITLKNSLKKLDLTLNDYKAFAVAKQIMGNNQTITMNGLTDMLATVEEDEKVFDQNWFKDILYRIKQKSVETKELTRLQKQFEDYDESNSGSLDQANFKTCLMRSQLKLSVKDINRIARYLNKDSLNRINYLDFLQQVDKIDNVSTSNDKVNNAQELAAKLTEYMHKQKLSVEQFLKNISNCYQNNQERMRNDLLIPNELFSSYLHKFIFQSTDQEVIKQLIEELDIDCDGFIEENDVLTFLQNHKYFDQIIQAPKISTRDYQVQKQQQIGTKTMGTKALFPYQPLSDQKFEQVQIDLRKKLDQKLMNYQALFKLLDADMNGFITIKEFSEQIDKMLSLSQPVKDGFFAKMDTLHIGMIDLPHFLEAMNKSVVKKEAQITSDTFDWQMDVIVKIREWFAKQRLTVEDAFRALDKNFQGQIQEKDMRRFLIEQIKVKEEEITEGKVNRLFKLMDQYKRGKVTCDDFKRFLCEDFATGQNSNIMGNQIIDNYSSFDWKLNAKQQLGLVLTRRFQDLSKSFDVISEYRKKILYSNFKKWVNDNNALKGFDLTEKLLQELFSDLDQHKKGHLTEQDWINAFSGYNWKQQMKQEVNLMINKHFPSTQKAFEFFQQNTKKQSINYSNFSQAITSLFPQRFIESDIQDLWQIYAGNNNQEIGKSKFLTMFGDAKEPYQNQSYIDISQKPKTIENETLTGKSLKELSFRSSTTTQAPFYQETLLDRLRRYLRSTNIQPKDILQQIDVNKSGLLTNIQFRNALQKMKLGLSQKDIDLLMNMCEQDGLLSWKHFLRLLDFRESDKTIIDRSKNQVKHIADLIYTYLISPKDAFRMFDLSSSGFLDFDQFQHFVKQIYQLDNDPNVPSYTVIKDLYEYFDNNNDQYIDLKEWMDVFSQYEVKLPKSDINKSPILTSVFKGKPSRSITAQLEESKNQFAKIYSNLKQNNFALRNQQLFQRPKTAQFNMVNQQAYLRYNQLQSRESQTRVGQWEASSQYDKIILTIGRNRRYLQDSFQQLNQRQIAITYNIAKSVIEDLLRNIGLEVQAEAWPILLKFAEKRGVIDYQFMLDAYKNRIAKIESHPRSASLNQTQYIN